MRKLRTIVVFFKWLLYAMLTQEARLRYEIGLNRGMHCTEIIRNCVGTITHVMLDPNRKPERDYVTRREFFEEYGLKKRAQ